MKQHITDTQFSELSLKGQSKLREWWLMRALDGDCFQVDQDEPLEIIRCCGSEIEDKDFVIPLLSIGQMIEFLEECFDHIRTPGDYWDISSTKKGWNLVYKGNRDDGPRQLELCDSLWAAVKEVLEQL